MNRAIINSSPIERYLYRQEYDIRDALKRFYESNTFWLHGTIEAQANRQAALREHGHEIPDDAVHNSWRTIDHDRRSAACLIEQHRARFWALGPLFAELVSYEGSLLFLTYANRHDRKAIGDLHRFKPDRYRRKIERVLHELTHRFPDAVAAGVIEVSAQQDSSGVVRFEPHCHVLVHGVPELKLKEAFRVLAKGAPRAVIAKPAHTIPDIGEWLSYTFKFSPELRVSFEGREGKSKPQDNLMTGIIFAEWLAWLSGYRVDELLITHGFSSNLKREFRETEVKVLVGAFMKSARQMPLRG